jgi:cytochrome c553
VLAACLLAVVGARAVRTYQGMRNEQRVRAGDAVGVRPWMTIPYISRVYGLPEDELFRTIGLSATEQRRRQPLQAIARQESHDLNADIAALNAAIDARRATPTAPPRAP